MSERFVRAVAEQWRQTQAELEAIRRDVNRIALQVRAEVAAGTLVYPDAGSLPAGALGRLATVADDGTGHAALYWHNGSTWVKVAP